MFVGGAARVEFKNKILREMLDLRIIWFGHSTARLAFEKMGMHAFSWMSPETTAFGIMFFETTKVWRNFMCVHGYGTTNGYTATSQGEPGLANNMRILVRVGDWLRFMHMKPISEDFRKTSIWRRHVEELSNLAVEEENSMRRCQDENEQYVSRPLRMSKKGAETLRRQPATGSFAGALMKRGGRVENRLQEWAKKVGEGNWRNRTKPWVSVRASRTLNGKDEEFAVFDGSLMTNEKKGVKSARILIEPKGGNKKSYPKMLEKYHEDKRDKYKNAVDLPAKALKLAFVTEMKLEDIFKLLKDCSRDKPVPVFRHSRNGRQLTPEEVINWKFEVIGYRPAETRKAEMAAAAEGAKNRTP